MTSLDLSTIGWGEFFAQQVDRDGAGGIVVRVAAHHGTDVEVLGEAGAFRVPIRSATAAGEIAVGDWLVLDPETHRAVRRFDRRSLLHRKAAGEEIKPQVIAANVDTVFLVSSCNEDFNLARLERYLTLVNQSGATPVIVLTKADRAAEPDEFRRGAEELQAGVAVVMLDAREAKEAEALHRWCGPGQTVALLGSSGVGKSTLANALGAGDLATGSIREHDGKGRHTTTSRSIHRLPTGGVLVDNPGVRELQLPASEVGIEDLFEDIIELESTCRFNNCGHDGDAGCAVAAAIDAGDLDPRRYDSYRKLQAEQERNARTLAERRARNRSDSKMYKSVMADKRRRRGGR